MELTIQLSPETNPVDVLGPGNAHVKLIREALGIHILARDRVLRLSGEAEAVDHAANLFAELSEKAKRGKHMDREMLLNKLALDSTRRKERAEGMNLDVYVNNQRIQPKSERQRVYLESIANHDLTFCMGPAGTGKTYLAVAAAVSMLKKGETRKIVLVRPAVEAGEKLGFLPGDMQEKVNPYLRPLLDAVNDMMPFDQAQRFMASDLIEVIPLAFMRGRTLNDAVIILDEAQNTTVAQMRMFLTRLGMGGKMIVTGDTTQLDLPHGTQSGLIDAARRLHRIPGIGFCVLNREDIVRHGLVRRIVEAYEYDDGGKREEKPQLPPDIMQPRVLNDDSEQLDDDTMING